MKRDWDGAELSNWWSLNFDELALTETKPPRTRLGFATQLKTYRLAGSFADHTGEVAAEPIAYLAEQLAGATSDLEEYDCAGRTGRTTSPRDIGFSRRPPHDGRRSKRSRNLAQGGDLPQSDVDRSDDSRSLSVVPRPWYPNAGDRRGGPLCALGAPHIRRGLSATDCFRVEPGWRRKTGGFAHRVRQPDWLQYHEGRSGAGWIGKHPRRG